MRDVAVDTCMLPSNLSDLVPTSPRHLGFSVDVVVGGAQAVCYFLIVRPRHASSLGSGAAVPGSCTVLHSPVVQRTTPSLSAQRGRCSRDR